MRPCSRNSKGYHSLWHYLPHCIPVPPATAPCFARGKVPSDRYGQKLPYNLEALRSLGLAVSDCEGILITHEHSDHVQRVGYFFQALFGASLWLCDTLDTLYSRGTIPPALDAIAMDGRTEDIGTFRVSSFPTSHDVPCCGYRVTTPDGHIMALATDLGVLTPGRAGKPCRLQPGCAGSQLRLVQPARWAVSLLSQSAHCQRPRPPGQPRLCGRAAGPDSGRLQKVRAVPSQPN